MGSRRQLEIKDAEEIARATKHDGVLIISFEIISRGGFAYGLQGVSYGQNKVKCKRMGDLLDTIIEAIERRKEVMPMGTGS